MLPKKAGRYAVRCKNPYGAWCWFLKQDAGSIHACKMSMWNLECALMLSCCSHSRIKQCAALMVSGQDSPSPLLQTAHPLVLMLQVLQCLLPTQNTRTVQGGCLDHCGVMRPWGLAFSLSSALHLQCEKMLHLQCALAKRMRLPPLRTLHPLVPFPLLCLPRSHMPSLLPRHHHPPAPCCCVC